jgi:hypothetical protein
MTVTKQRLSPAKWAAIATLGITLLAIYPQINLWIARGGQWQGSYVLVQGDEIVYSAYINALIDGRPRKNDPYMGRDDVPAAPLPESLFSIQMVPSYAIAIPARLFRISASTAFIALIVISAVAAALAIFWLLQSVTGDSRISATGVLVILCLGTLAAGQGEGRFMLFGQNAYDFFPYLRRYQPSIVFPMFFVFCALLWRAFTLGQSSARIRNSLAAGILFAVMVFTYFYMWTAALAWLSCFAIAWFVLRSTEWKRAVLTLAIVGVFALGSIAAFFLLLARRSSNMDSTQLLSHSRAPDLFYAPEVIAYVILAAIGLMAWRGAIELRDRAVVMAVSFALMPIAVFNQQVLTGLSLQPIHYQLFIANYAVLAGVVLAGFLLLRRPSATAITKKILIYASAAAFAWGVVEVAGSTRRNAAYARIRDDSMPVIKRLNELARADGTFERARATGAYPLVYSTNLMVAGNLATAAPQGILWAHHTPAAGVASLDQNKELFYYYLYYSGADEKELAQAMLDRQFNTLSALFGVERVITTLTRDAKPITTEDMRAEIRSYANFIQTFSKEKAARALLSYVVAPVQAEPNYANLDRWYERDAGEHVGIYVIYRVKPRP